MTLRAFPLIFEDESNKMIGEYITLIINILDSIDVNAAIQTPPSFERYLKAAEKRLGVQNGRLYPPPIAKTTLL